MMINAVNIQAREEQHADVFTKDCLHSADKVELFVARSIREAIAELAKIPLGRLRASDRFKVELRNLPFWDDYENKTFVDQMADVMGFALREEQYDRVPSPEFSRKQYTIAEFVRLFRGVLDPQQEHLINQMAD